MFDKVSYFFIAVVLISKVFFAVILGYLICFLVVTYVLQFPLGFSGLQGMRVTLLDEKKKTAAVVRY